MGFIVLNIMKVSNQKKEKISEHILAFLYSSSPKSLFTSHIAQEIARDEEFVKTLLLDLKKKNLVTEIKKNAKGKTYSKRQKWAISDIAFEVYKKHQELNK